MNIDERIERLEHITAGWIEQSKKELEEDRRLWREQREEIAAIWKATDRRFEESRQEWNSGLVEMRREISERDKVMDKRIADLVLAIGELCRKLDKS